MIAQHIKEFSKNAHSYDEYTLLQQRIAHYLVSHIDSKPRKILDLGCGSGAIFKNISWEIEYFTGVDSACGMCELHPKGEKIDLYCEDFESPSLLAKLHSSYDLLISSSALQWAHSLETLIATMALRCKEGALAIFTDKTFETIYTMTELPKFLPNAKTLVLLFEKHFACHHEIKTFRLFFDDNLSKFRYIKKSGVSGGQKRLSVAQTKALIHNYPHPYLEFEVLFLWGTSNTYKSK